jgi:hypothetical protein
VRHVAHFTSGHVLNFVGDVLDVDFLKPPGAQQRCLFSGPRDNVLIGACHDRDPPKSEGQWILEMYDASVATPVARTTMRRTTRTR